MTTNKPEVVSVYRTDTGGTDKMVCLSDYEALQIEYLNTTARAVEQIVELEAEIEKLRKDAEFGRAVLSKREPGKKYGCHCDLEEDMEPDECVIDIGERLNCVHAKDIEAKEQCEYWRVFVTDSDEQGDGA